jgi:prolyl oligopeptidase
MARIPGRDALIARFKTIEAGASGLTTGVTRTQGGRWFYEKREPGGETSSAWCGATAWMARRSCCSIPRRCARSTGEPHAILDFAPSPDGKRIAYAVQRGGGEIGTLHVVDVDSGRELAAPVDRIRYASVQWLDDGSGFFYNRLREGYDKLPATERFQDNERHFHAHDAQNTDRVVFQPSRAPELGLPAYAIGYVFQVPGTRTAAMWVALGVERYGLMYVADLDAAIAGTAKWRPVATAKDEAADFAVAGGAIYLRSYHDAPRFKVLRVAVDSPDLAKAEVVIPPGRGVITGIAGARDALYVARREGVTTTLLRVAHGTGAKTETVALPFAGYAEVSADPRVPGVVLELGGWTHATRPYAYDPAARRVAALPFVKIGAFDAPTDIEAREVMVKSHDGAEVPLSILAKKGVKLDGSNPTILYGYGAYGITDDPFFNPRIYAWLERGGVYAVAHVRGGGAFGAEWHMAGRRATKPNTWKDAIAAAEWLVANRYTAPGKLGIYGGSAGGIFVGRAITERPDLFAAAVPVVGWFDAIRIETSANGVANIPEFGTVKNEDEFPRPAGDGGVQPCQARDRVPGGHARARRQRHPRGRLAVHQDGVAAHERHDQRPPGVAAPGIRLGPRPGKHARAAAGAHGRRVRFHAVAVRGARLPAAPRFVTLANCGARPQSHTTADAVPAIDRLPAGPPRWCVRRRRAAGGRLVHPTPASLAERPR